MLREEFGCIAHGLYFFRRVIGYLTTELFLKRHDELNRIETVGSQIVDKARIFADLRLVDAEMLDDDFLHAPGDIVAHVVLHSKFNTNTRSHRRDGRQPHTRQSTRTGGHGSVNFESAAYPCSHASSSAAACGQLDTELNQGSAAQLRRVKDGS